MLQVMVSFAQLDNKLRSTRIKEGMKKAKEKGKKFGTPSNLSTYYERLENQVDPEGRRFEIREELEALAISSEPISEQTKQKLLREEAEIIDKVRQLQATPPTIAREKKALERAKLILPIVEECEDEGHTSFRQLAKCLTDKGILTPSGKEVWSVGNVQTLKKQIAKIKKSED